MLSKYFFKMRQVNMCHFMTTFQVFGEISGLKFVPSEVVTAVQKHTSEMDVTLGHFSEIKSKEMRRIH